MASIKDVARAAGVSVSTVSHVINKTRFVSPETTIAVQKIVDDLGFQPSYLARALKSKRTQTIGMLVTSSTNPFFAEIVSGVEEGCYRNGYSLILGNSGESPGRQLSYLDTLTRRRIDAIVIMTASRDADFQSQLDHRVTIPRVVLDSEPIQNGCAIGDDSVTGGYLATEYLIRQGHKKIGCLTGPNHHPRSNERLIGYKKAMNTAGLPINDNWIIAAELTAQKGHGAATQLLGLKDRPTALFAFNDLMAAGAYRAIQESNLSIPNDISIIGYDDIEIASYLYPALTTIRQPGFELGLEAADILIKHLENGIKLPQQVRKTPELIVRSSVAEISS